MWYEGASIILYRNRCRCYDRKSCKNFEYGKVTSTPRITELDEVHTEQTACHLMRACHTKGSL